MKDRKVIFGICGNQGHPRGCGAYNRLPPEFGCSNNREGERKEKEKEVGRVHVRCEALSRDAAMILATLGHRSTWGCSAGHEQKVPSNMSHMNLNDSNLTYPSLALLAGAQLRLSKQGHRKFIPKQLRFRDFPRILLAKIAARWCRRCFKATLTFPGILNLIFRSMNAELDVSCGRPSGSTLHKGEKATAP